MATIAGSTGNDTLTGTGAGDRITAGDGNDAITAGSGNDSIFGGSGNDTITAGAASNPPVQLDLNWAQMGADGTNLARGVTQDTGGVSVNVRFVNDGRATGFEVDSASATYVGRGETFDPKSSLLLTGTGAGNTSTTYVGFSPVSGSGFGANVENVRFRLNDIDRSGSNWQDVITIRAYDAAGNEVTVNITAAGNDTVVGNRITAGNTADNPDAAAGSALIEIPGPVARFEIDYNNTYSSGQVIWVSDVQFEAQNTDHDYVEAGSGHDSVLGGFGNDTLLGQDGQDTLNGQLGDDQLFGGLGDDSLLGEDGNDTLAGGDGDDTLSGGAGQDSLLGDAGNDQLFGGIGNDTLDGGADDDTLAGGEGDDLLYGGLGNDLLEGEAGNDSLFGGAGADTLDGGLGNDLLKGDDGNDSLLGGAGHDTLHGGHDADTLRGGDGADSLLGEDGDDSLFGDGGNDRLFGGLGNDTLYGGDGDDTILFGDGNDVVYGGDGNDFIDDEEGALLTGNDYVDAGAGNDTVYTGHGDDTILGGTGKDLLIGETGNDLIYGGADNDTLYGDLGDDTLHGGDGADLIYGGDGQDLIYGGAGDVIDGGSGGIDFDVLDMSLYGKGSYRINYDPTNRENGTVDFLDDKGAVTGSLKFTEIEKVMPCFTPGTLIATPNGPCLVEDLQEGDLVLTRDSGLQPVRWVGRRDLGLAQLIVRPAFCPVRIAKGALGQGLPLRDLVVSPQHRMLIQGALPDMLFGESEVLVAAVHLVGQPGITQQLSRGVSYIHMMFDQHEIVMAEGAWTESFQPGDTTLQGMDDAQRDEVLSLFPELVGDPRCYRAARMTLKAHEVRVLMAC